MCESREHKNEINSKNNKQKAAVKDMQDIMVRWIKEKISVQSKRKSPLIFLLPIQHSHPVEVATQANLIYSLIPGCSPRYQHQSTHLWFLIIRGPAWQLHQRFFIPRDVESPCIYHPHCHIISTAIQSKTGGCIPESSAFRLALAPRLPLAAPKACEGPALEGDFLKMDAGSTSFLEGETEQVTTEKNINKDTVK